MSLLRVAAIVVGDEPDDWEAAGFTVDGSRIDVGGVIVDCLGDGSRPRWRLHSEDDLPDSIDGLATEQVDAAPSATGASHRNEVVDIDHVVLASPDLDRTTEAFGALGVDCRRVRDVPGSDPAMQQRFFRLGSVILELIGSAEATGDGPMSIWGLACNVADIDAAAERLGPACGAPKDAVQPGRRIATVRTRDLGISLPIALMTPDPRYAARS